MRDWKPNHVKATLANRSLTGTGYYDPGLPPVDASAFPVHATLFPATLDDEALRARIVTVSKFLQVPEIQQVLRAQLQREEPMQDVFDSFFDKNSIVRQVRGVPAYTATLRAVPGAIPAGLAGVRAAVLSDAGAGKVQVTTARDSFVTEGGTHKLLGGAYHLQVTPVAGSTGSIRFTFWIPDFADPVGVLRAMELDDGLFTPVVSAPMAELHYLFTGSRVVSTRLAAGLAALFWQLESRRG